MCIHSFYHPTALPEFVNANISITTTVQSEVILPCDIIPDPTVTFTWQFGGMLITPSVGGGTYTILPNGSLVVANVGEVHEGTYTCVVTNPLGVASGTVVLTVNSKRAPLKLLLCTRPYMYVHVCIQWTSFSIFMLYTLYINYATVLVNKFIFW